MLAMFCLFAACFAFFVSGWTFSGACLGVRPQKNVVLGLLNFGIGCFQLLLFYVNRGVS